MHLHSKTQMKSLTILLTVCLSLTLCDPTQSQIDVRNLKFERFSEEQGLSSRFTTCMLQDRFGFLWFGTQSGLNRYDGYEVSLFLPRLQDSTAIAGGFVRQIYEDRKGGLWIGTVAALNRFNRATETFTVFRPEPEDPSHPGNLIMAILEDRSGLFWVGTMGGYYSFDPTTGTFKRQTPDDARPPRSAGARPLYEDREGVVWLSAVNPGNPKLGGLYRFDPDTTTLNLSHNRPRTHYNHEPDDSSSLSHNSVVSILEDTSGTLWFATYFRGLVRMIDRDAGRFESFRAGPGGGGLPGDGLRFLHEDRSGTLWTGGVGGLARYNRKDNTFTSYRFDNKNPGDRANNILSFLYEDRDGNLWMWGGGGPLRGLRIFEPKTERFTHYRQKDAEGLRQIMDIQEDDAGSVWIVTGNDGIIKVDQAAKPFITFRHDPTDPESLGGNRITSVYEDRSGTLWVGTFANGLNKLVSRSSKGKDTFKHYTHDPENPNSLSSTWVNSIYEDQAGVLWVGTGAGLDRFHPKTEIFTHFQHDPKDSRSLSPKVVNAIYEDREGVLWVGTRAGLNTMKRATGTFTRYLRHLEASTGSGGGGVLTIYEDRAGTLWFGLDNEGLKKYDRGRGTFTSYLHDPGDPNSLSSLHVGGITEDKAGNLWLATGMGLNQFDRQTQSFTRFGQEDGFASNQIGGLILEQDLLWFGNKGISTFDPVH